eukprot:CAMPEP_0117451248 /NCGR_PEP_ID=MMETSP0759-20121206/8906_1 /TAXON_ID=63605 /ORGANISM="Percolomonas cosmopolitus, Strain WS" /LENGTH=246 /DNA_ID=CAMNT_0005243835 /DNA_START=1 /DNA_END=741 /DNA_ORIENTATION=-
MPLSKSRIAILPRAFSRSTCLRRIPVNMQQWVGTSFFPARSQMNYSSQSNNEDNSSTQDDSSPNVQQEMQKVIEGKLSQAESGDSKAMLDLAMIHLSGTGVEKNPEEGLKWIKRAEELNDSSALTVLGIMHETGMHRERDLEKAIDYFKRAADFGDAEGQMRMAFAHANGQVGGERDMGKALEFFEMAANQNHPEGLFFLGSMYENGVVVNQDKEKALELYKRANEQGGLKLASDRIEALEKEDQQ